MNAVPAGGPNGGVKWVERLNPNNLLRWQYRWVIHPDIDDLNCAFSLQQTGTYHQVNNPTGWIRGVNLRANGIRHEAGSVASHYVQFAAAAAVNDPGTAVEGLLAPPADSFDTFDNEINLQLGSVLSAVRNATNNPEPPGIEYYAAGNFQGFINFAPYGSGCHP